MKLAVFVHEPLTNTGWDEVERDVTPDEAATLARYWGARGWRVLSVSMGCIQEGWEMNYPTPA